MLDEICPECGKQLQRARGPVRSVRGLQRLPGVPLHQEGPAEEHRRHVPAVRRGRADREAQPLRLALLQLQPLPGLRLCRRATLPSPNGPAPSAARSCCDVRSPCAAGVVARSWIWSSNVTKSGDVEAETAVARGEGRRARVARAAAKKKTDREEDTPKTREEDRREEGEGEGGGLAARVDLRRRGRGAARHEVGHPQGPPDPPGVLPPAGGDVGVVAGGLGRVRRRDLARHDPVRLRRDRGPRGRRGDDRAHAAGDPVRAGSRARSSIASIASRS